MISATYRFRQAIAKNLLHAAGLLLIPGLFLPAANSAQANNIIPIVNGDFESQTIPASPGFIAGVITGWTNPLAGDGVFINSAYGMPNPAGGTNGAFINAGDMIYQNIGKVLDNNTYTVNFSVGTDGGTGFPSTINVELFSGVSATPTTLLGSAPGTVSNATHVYDPFTVTFPFTTTGHAGENLFLEFVGGSASRFLDNVSASVTPEPSSLLLAALATAGLAIAGRRRQCRVGGRSFGGQAAGLRKNLWKLGVILAFVAAGSFAGANTARATLISQYTLGENGLTGPPVDTTGNHNFINSNGNPTLDTSTHAPAAGSTASLAFSGAEGYYFVQPYPTVSSISNNFVVDIWAKAASTGNADSRLLSTDGVGSGGVGSLQIGVTNGHYTADVTNGTPGNSAGTIFATAVSTITTDWTELTLKDFGGTTTFYVNGVAQGSTSVAVAVGEQMHLGVAPGGSSFVGNLDQLTVNTVPEPSSMVLCGLGGAGLYVAARRRKA